MKRINRRLFLTILVAWLSFSTKISYSQIDSVEIEKPDTLLKNAKTIESKYSFLIYDTPHELFTMRQFNQNYLSLYRLGSEKVYTLFPKKYFPLLIQTTLSFIFLPLTHEEGHRSILTANKIGSISKPFFSSKGVASVVGVRDSELKNLRDTKLSDYIRLHTAGLESDYMLTLREESLLAFEAVTYREVGIEYTLRKLSSISYYLFSAIPSLSPDIDEEKDELNRDIVGHDVYGAIRHFHRPTMTFFRYSDYEDLTQEEKRYTKRVAYKSLLNLFSPQLLGFRNFKLSENLKGNISVAYSMAPFGDYIDNNIWLKVRNRVNMLAYQRFFKNRSNGFYGAGVKFYDFELNNRISLSGSLNYWSQPKNLSFVEDESAYGGSGDATISYKLFDFNKDQNLSFDLGLQYKSYGFLPEEVVVNEQFSLRFGFSYFVKR